MQENVGSMQNLLEFVHKSYSFYSELKLYCCMQSCMWFTFTSVYYKVVNGLAMAIYVRILPVISDIHTRGVSVRDDGFSGLGTQTRGVRLHELLL